MLPLLVDLSRSLLPLLYYYLGQELMASGPSPLIESSPPSPSPTHPISVCIAGNQLLGLIYNGSIVVSTIGKPPSASAFQQALLQATCNTAILLLIIFSPFRFLGYLILYIELPVFFVTFRLVLLQNPIKPFALPALISKGENLTRAALRFLAFGHLPLKVWANSGFSLLVPFLGVAGWAAFALAQKEVTLFRHKSA